jgi:redox-sensing transcriptional repressor
VPGRTRRVRGMAPAPQGGPAKGGEAGASAAGGPAEAHWAVGPLWPDSPPPGGPHPTAAGAGARDRLPEVAVRRLPVYLRALSDLQAAGYTIVSSAELAERTGLTSEQIRKDLAMLGGFGTRGVGYRLDRLTATIRSVLGLDRPVPVALVGAGHLGTALARYNESRRQQPSIRAIFDADPSKVGQPLGGTVVRSMDELDATVRELGIRLAIIAVPASAAQQVAERLVAAGCDVLLNFAPVRLSLPAGIRVHNVDLAMELEALAYYVRAEAGPEPRP